MVSVVNIARTLVGVLALAVTVKAHPLAGSANSTRALDCCEHESPPWENAICEAFASPTDGSCLTIWWNGRILRRDAADTFANSDPVDDTSFEAGIASSNTNPAACNAVNIENQSLQSSSLLSKRLSFERTDTMQWWCQDDSNTVECLRRDRNANPDECRTLAGWWEQEDRFGRWIIESRDLAGWNWLPLIQHNSCMFAVGNTQQNLPDSTRLGNGDFVDTLRGAVRSCGPLSRGIEAEGVLACHPFPLGFWVTNSDRCC